MRRSVLLVMFLISTKIKAMRSDSDEDAHLYLETNPYRRTTMNFDDIFARSLTTLLLADQTSSSSTTEEDFHLTIPTQYIDNPKTQSSRVTPTLHVHLTSPSPTSKKSRRRKTTTEEYIEEIKPTKITTTTLKYQRGVLDLLFPAARVKGFKSFFDGFRKILSHTFK
ncbi:uncharacterized protein [Choristoneura fumiferana]|uniref:uncharacterized protein n=1 Tax=Choristoneura fumiferana TaxID=7141 RepID=UPI003D159D8A